MTVWEVLGIEPTDNARAIKRAYAKQVAVYHPEDHPQEFQRLQDAYEEALKQAQGTSASAAPSAKPRAAAEAKPRAAAASAEAEDASERAAVRRQEDEKRRAQAVKRAERRMGAQADAEVSAVASREVKYAYRTPDAPADAACAVEGDFSFITRKLAADEDARTQAMLELRRLEAIVSGGGNVVAYFEGGAYARLAQADGFAQAAAQVLVPFVDKLSLKDAQRLEKAVGAAPDDFAMRDVFERRRARTRKLVMTVLAAVVVLALAGARLYRIIAS